MEQSAGQLQLVMETLLRYITVSRDVWFKANDKRTITQPAGHFLAEKLTNNS